MAWLDLDSELAELFSAPHALSGEHTRGVSCAERVAGLRVIAAPVEYTAARAAKQAERDKAKRERDIEAARAYGRAQYAKHKERQRLRAIARRAERAA